MRCPPTSLLGPLLATAASAIAYTLACLPYEVTALAWLVPGLLLAGTRTLPAVRPLIAAWLWAVTEGMALAAPHLGSPHRSAW